MRRSISQKLLASTVGVILVVVALAGGVLLRQHRRALYSGFEDGAVVLARAVAEHCVAPLYFDDADGAHEILAKLEKSTEVNRAVLFDRHGRQVASYERPGAMVPLVSLQGAPSLAHGQGYLHVFEPVYRPQSARPISIHPDVDEQQGTLYLAADSAGLQARVRDATITIVLAGAAAILAAALLAWLLQRNLTRPILRLAETMRGIDDQTIRSTRMNHASGDEIGELYAGFNRMLDQLTAREIERDRSGARLRALIAALPDPVFVLAESGIITEVFAGRPDALAHAVTELRGQNITAVVGHECRVEDAIAAALRSGPQRLAYELELAAGKRWFDAVLVPIGAEEREPVVLFVPRDVTERHTLELELRQVQKMEALGRLAGGVAHDFNNILTAIMGYGSLLVGRLEREGDPGSEVAEVLKAAERAAQLTQQLLAFSRRQVVAFRHVSLNELVGDMQRMLERIIGEDVQLVADLASNLPYVYLDPSQLQQVILNLAVNAREAMPGGGTLSLSTTVFVQSARRAGEPGLAPGRYVLLKVTDTGVGMDESVRVRIFEPFFTTKGRKGGTGLGLAMVYGIVRQAGGDVSVASEPARGSTFSIYLPEAPVPRPEIDTEIAPRRVLPRGNETVLVVEDEPQLLELACRMLREQGYDVLNAADARQALQICSVHPAPIHLLLTDVVMPKMGGGELVQAARPLRPNMKVMFMSGYTDATTVQHGVAAGQAPFLQKPFTPEDLIRRVRETLGVMPGLDRPAASPQRPADRPS